jgi:hypothetical protein
LGNDADGSAQEVWFMGSAHAAHPPSVRVSGRAQADTLREAQPSPAFVPLRTGDGPSIFAHRQAYPMLVGRAIEVDCRRRSGLRSFSSSLPPDLGLRTSFGRETGGDRPGRLGIRS